MNDRVLPAPGDDDLLLQRALDDELRPSERLAFEERLEAEPRLRERLDEMVSMRAMRLLARPRGGLGLDFADRVVARCQELAKDEADPSSSAVVSSAAVSSAATTTTKLESTSAATTVVDAAPADPVRLRSWLETAIVLAAGVLLVLGVSLFARSEPDPATIQASPQVREEVRQLYRKLAEKERLRRRNLELEMTRPRTDEGEIHGSGKDR